MKRGRSLGAARVQPALLLLLGLAGAASGAAAPAAEATAGAAFVCRPRDQLREAGRCLALGPGGEMERRARQGEAERPLPTLRGDPDLAYVPFEYVHVKDGGGALYPSPDAAAAGSGGVDGIPEGTAFLSYSQVMEVGGQSVYATARGYVRGDGVTEITPLGFRGLTFSRTPDRPFGWVVSGTLTQGQPGGAEDWTDHWLPKFALVTIRNEFHDGDTEWYEVAPGEWVEHSRIARVMADPTPPEGVEGDRWIRVNLYEQTVEAYQEGSLVYATIASTGRYGYWTQPGLFQVWAKLERDVMTGGISEPGGGNFYYLEDVPWVLYFDKSRGLHGTYWHGRFGLSSSRGCVNLAPTDAHWFYDFAEEGTWVYVWDPSGQTPTDPSFYGAGGA